MDKKYKSLFLNTLIFALGSIGSKLILFILLPLYTNVLTTAEYGISEIVTTVSTLIVPLISLSIGDSVLRFGIDKGYDSDKVLNGALYVNVIGTFFLLSLFPVLALIGILRDYVIHLILISVFSAFRTTLLLYAKATNHNVVFGIDSIINTAVLAGSNIVLLLVFKSGINGYLWSQIISLIVSVVFLFISLRKVRPSQFVEVDFSILKEMLKYSIPLIINAVSWWLIYSTDKLMINYFLGEDQVGIYSVSAKIPSLINTVTYFFSQAWVLSAITEYNATRDLEFYRRVFRIYNYFLCLAVSFVLLFLKPFMQIYVGADFRSAWLYVPLLLIATIFRNYSDFFGAFFASAKKNILILITTSVGAICNVALNAILIPLIGVQGAVIGTAVSFIVIGLFRIAFSRKILRFKIYYLEAIPTLLLVTAQAIFVMYEWHMFIVSAIVIATLMAINFCSNKNIICAFSRMIKRKKEKSL